MLPFVPGSPQQHHSAYHERPMWLRKVLIPLSPAGLLTDDLEAAFHAALPPPPLPNLATS